MIILQIIKLFIFFLSIADFLRRHKVPLPDGPKNQHYTVLDFNVGKVLKIYSRDFVVIGCDEFTRVCIFLMPDRNISFLQIIKVSLITF